MPDGSLTNCEYFSKRSFGFWVHCKAKSAFIMALASFVLSSWPLWRPGSMSDRWKTPSLRVSGVSEAPLLTFSIAALTLMSASLKMLLQKI